MSSVKYRIALIGNMNNNHFTLMRYFRDLGHDAYLFPFKDELDHFQPWCDTFEIEKWSPYIKILPFKNGNLKRFLFLSKDEISQEIVGFDYYIGTGFAPAYFYKSKLKLDIFIPYCVYIEFLVLKRYKTYNLTKRISNSLYYYFQKKGLVNNTKIILTADKTAIETCNDLHLNYKNVAVPCVYNGEAYDQNPEIDSNILRKVRNSDLVIFSHVSHNYVNIDPVLDIKRNNILIEGFSKYIAIKKLSSPLLVMTEYGKDVNHSKQLIEKLGISNYVIWLSKMNRKDIFSFLKHADFGGGEFGGLLWGGTGWEFISMGIPFFQYTNLTQEEFQNIVGCPMPSFVNTNSANEIAETLLDFEKNPEKYKKMGKELKEWFNKFNGISLAKEYLNILEIGETLKKI